MNHSVSKVRLKFAVGVFFSIALVLYGCVKDYVRPIATTEYSPLVAIPIINSNLTSKNLLNKDYNGGTLTTDSTHFITLIYKGHLVSLEAADIINLPSQNFSTTTPAVTGADVAAFNALPIGSNYTLPVFTDTVNFNTSGSVNIDTVMFKNGTMLNLNISSQFAQNATIVVTIPSAKKNGIPLSQTFNLIYAGTLPVVLNANIDLSGYTVDMTEGGTTSSKFNINFTVTLDKTTANPLNVTDNATFNLGFTNPLFQKIFGYILQPLLSPRFDTVPITIFGKTVPGGGKFTLVNPSVKFIVTNSYGAPISATFNTLEGYSPIANNYPITITDPTINPWKFPYPTITQIGQSEKDSITLSNANTANTIGSVINNLPQNFVYSVSAQANPNGKPVWPNTNFVLDTSKFNVDFQVNMPLWGTASNIMLYDTVPFTLGTNNVSAIQSLLIRVNANNGFPVNMGLQVYFTDSISPAQQYNIVDSVSVTGPEIIPSGNVDTNTGVVISPLNKITDNYLNQARISKLKNCKKILLKGLFTTTNNGKTNVKIYSTYYLGIKIGVEAQLQTRI